VSYGTVTVTGIGTPAMLSPVGDITNSHPTFQWTPVAQATYYIFTLQKQGYAPTSISVAGTSYQRVNGLTKGNWTWSVQAFRSDGRAGLPSQISSFTVK
jgi:hypothetical protein